MKNKLFVGLYGLSLISMFFLSCNDTAKNDIEQIRENFYKIYTVQDGISSDLRDTLIKYQPGCDATDRVVMELQHRVPYLPESIEKNLSLQQEDGSWKDIDYTNKQRSGWIPQIHAERIHELVTAYYNKEAEHYKSPKVCDAIHRAMNFWFKSNLKCPNWYYNEIGIPRTMGSAFVMFKDEMSEHELNDAVKLMENSKFGMSGQNKIWLAGNVMMKGILQDDYKLVKSARDTIVSEIVTGNFEGIKDDWSFHQHGAQQQFGNYGLAYVYTMSLMSGILSNTSLSFTKEHLDVISNLIKEGYQRIIWNGKMDINSLGRQLFIHAPIRKALSMGIAANDLGKYNEQCKEIQKSFLKNSFTSDNEFVGIYHYWQSDYTIKRTSSWMTSLKMASDRVMGVEQMNGDNMKGYYMADGAMYLYKTGNEYFNIFPLWDWRKLPGTTCYEDEGIPMLRKSYYPGNSGRFVGGLTDGNTGISAMHLNRDGLDAKKAWIFDGNEILCLGTGIHSDSLLNVTTSVEQCWAMENPEIMGNFRKKNKFEYAGDDIRVLHNNIGYVMVDNNGMVVIKNELRSGTWHEIMQPESNDTVNGNIFNIYIEHGKAPKNANYCYIIIPETDKEQLQRFDPYKYAIISNTETIQAVYSKETSSYWIAVYKDCPLKLNRNLKVNLTTGLYKIKELESGEFEICYCDPTQSKDEIAISINGISHLQQLPLGKKKGTTLKFIL